MTKAISECPVCHGKELRQKLLPTSYRSGLSGVIGGPHTTCPSKLNGCYCGDCSTAFEANVAGKCPICQGTGKMKYVHYQGSYDRIGRASEEKCWGCNGTGKLGKEVTDEAV